MAGIFGDGDGLVDCAASYGTRNTYPSPTENFCYNYGGYVTGGLLTFNVL
jgi:tetrahydromethanopterin S-methyltransferase subunit E